MGFVGIAEIRNILAVGYVGFGNNDGFGVAVFNQGAETAPAGVQITDYLQTGFVWPSNPALNPNWSYNGGTKRVKNPAGELSTVTNGGRVLCVTATGDSLDEARMRHNIGHMQARIGALGVRLRPHVKTAKCLPVARVAPEGLAELVGSGRADPRKVYLSVFEEREVNAMWGRDQELELLNAWWNDDIIIVL